MNSALPSIAGSPRSGRFGGFTLIELLVVIAITAILASLLLPALSKAKATGQSTACLNNLKQLQLCWQMYVDDYADYLPPNRIKSAGGVWTSLPGSWVLGNVQKDASATNIENGLLFAYNGSLAIYRCPSDHSTVPGQQSSLRSRSYSLNYYLNTEENGSFDSHVKRKYAQLVEPSPTKVFCFLDVNEQCIGTADFLIPHFPGHPNNPNGTAWGDLPSDRHNLGANLSFADGHAKHYRWLWPKRFKAFFQEAANAQDLQDLRRMQAGNPTQ